MIGLVERSSGDGAAADGNDVFRVSHLIVETTQNGRHLGGDGAANENDVGLAGTVSGHLEAEAGDVIACCTDCHELDATATGSKSQWPKRVGTSPVDEVIQFANHDVCAAGIEFGDELLVGLVVFEILVGDRLDFCSFHCHFNAPFLQA